MAIHSVLYSILAHSAAKDFSLSAVSATILVTSGFLGFLALNADGITSFHDASALASAFLAFSGGLVCFTAFLYLAPLAFLAFLADL